MKKLLYLLIAALLLPLALEAKIPDMKFRRLDIREGLSNSSVNCIFRDSRGYVWIGTAYGLNRYDGYRVKTFFSNFRDSTTMRENSTSEIMEDWEGKLWLHQGMNYSVYDPVTERFERNAARALEPYIGQFGGVDRLFIDRNKNFWVKTNDEGIIYYNPKTKKKTVFKSGYGADEINPTYGISTVTDDYDNNNVVFATFNGELISLNGEKGVKVWEQKWIRENGGPENREYRLSIDQQHNLWVSTENYTFIYINSEKRWYRQIEELLEARQIPCTLSKLQVWDVKVDRHGRIWAATDHEGLVVVDLKNHEVRQFLTNKYDETSISENTLRKIYIDNKGLVWIGTYKNGVNMYKEGSQSMRNLELGDINTVSEDRYGNYWLGTNEKGIVVYNPKSGEEVAHYTTENTSMLGNIMVGSCSASDGSIWFGSYNGGLTRCIPQDATGKATVVNYRATNDGTGLATNNIWSVTEDHWHRIWLGTLGAGIQQFDLKTGKWRTWNQENAGLPGNYMTSASWIKKGWLMVGSSWYYCFVNPVTGKLANRVIPEDPRVPVQTGSSICVMEDSRELIWQGSNSGALVYDQKRNFQRLLDMNDGLFGSSICSIIEDQDHTIWIVTDHGVSKVIPKLQSDNTWQFNISSYNNRDGLQQTTYNQRSTCLTHDGLILIGGQGGLDVINPKTMSDAKSKERPVFSGLLLFDVAVPVNREIEGRVILDEALDICREVSMRYNDQFTIQLASDAGMVNNAKRFVYQLEGFNENWVKTSELNPNITYNSLSPGDYTLHVRMLNDDGTFGSEESTMEISIRPPFWRSRWMQLFYLLLVCVGVWFWRKWYVKYHARRVEAEELRRETEKLQWMSEMHMKISKERAENPQAPLTSGEGGDKPAGLQLTLKEENIVEAIKDICKEFLITPTGLKAKLSCQSMTDEIMGEIDHDKLAEALNILLTNSVRFAPGKCIVNINIGRSDKDHAVIQVADNGVGIRDEFKATAFDPMIGTEGIGLDKVKDIVVAHGGTIRLQDNPGGGTIFIISLPVQPEVVIEDAVMMDDDE